MRRRNENEFLRDNLCVHACPDLTELRWDNRCESLEREIERCWLDYYGLDGLFVDAKVQFKMMMMMIPKLPKFLDD